MNQRSFSYQPALVGLLVVLIISGLFYLDRALANEDLTNQINPESGAGLYIHDNPLSSRITGEGIAYVTLQDSNLVALVDVVTQTVVGTIDTSQYGCDGPWRASMTPDGGFVYFSCLSSSSVLVLEADTNSVVINIPSISVAYDVAFTQAGDYALVGSLWADQIAIIDTVTFDVVQYIYTNDNTRNLATHPFRALVYATSGDGEILVIETDTFTIIDSIQVDGIPSDVAVSADGNWVFAGDENGNGLWVIDANTNTLYTTVSTAGGLTSLEVSSDGAYIYAGGWSEVWIIDGNTFNIITSVFTSGSPWGLELTCDETQLYVGNTTNEVVVIDALNFNISGNIPMPGDTTRGIAICPQYVVEGAYLSPPTQTQYAKAGETITYTLQMINLTGMTDSYNLELLPGNTFSTTLSTELIGPVEDGETTSFTAIVEVPPDAQPGDSDTATIQATSVISPSITDTATINTLVLSDETAYLTLDNSNLVAMVDTTTQVVLGTIDTSQHGCYGPIRARMSPDGNFVYFGCMQSGSVLVIETATNSVVTNIENIAQATDVIFTPSGNYALVSSFWVTQIAVIDTTTYSIIQQIYTSEYSRSLAMHPYRELAYATCGNGEILVIDTSTFTIIDSIYVGGTPGDVAISADGNWIFSGDQNGNLFWVIDANTNSVYTTISGLGAVLSIEVSSDGAYIYTGGEFSQVWIIDGLTFTPITSVYINESAWDLELTCDETQLYVGNNTSDAVVIDALNFNVIGYIPMPGNTSRGIAICPQYVAEGVFLIPYLQAKDGGRGEAVVYQETLFNNSGITETFILEALGYQWDTQLSVNQIGPITSGESGSFNITVMVPEDAAWYDTDYASIIATGVTSPSLTAEAQLMTTAYAPAQISVEPDSLQSTQLVGEVTTQTLTISNGEGVTLTFEIIVGGNEGGALEVVLDSLNTGYQSVTDLIPNRYDFSEGEIDCFIDDGGNDMYDGGNYLNTDLGGNICYSNNTIVENSYFGINGRYFTSKLPGLFVLAADMQNVDSFQISGNLGADGGGMVDGTILQTEVNGVNYYGFVKRVFNAGDPSVNHLIIVAENPYAGYDFNTNTDDDYHEIANLGINTRLYYLLYAGAQGDYIDDANTLAIMRAFLLLPGVSAGAEWLLVDPDSGAIPDNSSLDTEVTMDATGLQPGLYETALYVSSNDPLTPFVSIPVTLTVEPTAEMGHVSGSVSDAWTGNPLTAMVELEGVYTTVADPDYNIWAVAGTYSLTAYTADYYTVTQPVEIVAGEVTIQDISLEPAFPRLGELPTQISMSLTEGSTGMQELELANNGPMTLDFAFFEINPLKTLEGANNLMGMQILYDQAHCQEDLYWYSYLTADLVAAGATIDENFGPFDETTLEGYDILWLNDGGCDWTYEELQILDDWLAEGGAVLIQSENFPGASGPASIFGITYQYGNCGYGTTTYINPHPISEGVDEFYIEGNCNYITGSPVEVILDPWYILPQVIAAEQGGGKMIVVADNDFIDWAIITSDNRQLAMNVFQWLALSVYGDIAWLSEEPEQGSVAGHSSFATTLNFDATTLNAGVYDAILAIEHNDPNQDSPMLIPVQLTVTTAVAPGTVLITGPEAGLVGQSLDFNAWVGPISTTLPITYTWQADGQPGITHTGGLTDTVSFTWELPGTQVITVTASNLAGSVMDTHVINIAPLVYETYLPMVTKSGGKSLEPEGRLSVPGGGALAGLVILGMLGRRKRI